MTESEQGLIRRLFGTRPAVHFSLAALLLFVVCPAVLTPLLLNAGYSFEDALGIYFNEEMMLALWATAVVSALWLLKRMLTVFWWELTMEADSDA